jgi:opacity protein-like surface antigen
VWGPLYAGVELETDSGRSSWQHERLPEGRSYSVDARGSDGASLRIGYATGNGALLYVHGGRARGRFRLRYEKGENPDAWVDREDTLAGKRLGLGLETPLSAHLFIRLDYSVTEYSPIEFSTIHDKPDELRFTHRQALARLGIGFRF